MLVVEFDVNSPILREALAHAPETRVSYEEQHRTTDGISFLFWAEGGDPADFEDGLKADPTVTDTVRLAETKRGRLYRVTFTEQGERVATFPSWSELDFSMLDSTGRVDGWDVRMRIPDREALSQYRQACAENDLGFKLTSIYEETDAATEAESRLTADQQEALLTAHELGYFEIPRRASLADVASDCGVSSQAASERIRRGTATLVDATL